MANHAVLDNISHKDIKIITQSGSAYGDNVSLSTAFISEFMQLQSWYPLFFRHNTELNNFEPVVLLGVKPGQNLFLQGDSWQSGYIPLSIQRQPFLIGFQQQLHNGVPQQVPVVCIDLDHPRVSLTQGEAVFLPHGGNSPLLEHISTVLQHIQQGHLANQAFCAMLSQLNLLQSLTLELSYQGAVHKVGGLYNIDRQQLSQLNAAQLQQLHQHGYLEAIYLLLASQANISKMLTMMQA